LGAKPLDARLFNAGSALLKVLPVTVRDGAATALGNLGYALQPGLRRQAQLNYSGILHRPITSKHVRRTARRAVVGYGKLLGDFLVLSRLKPEEIRAMVEVEGIEHIQRARQAGKGVVIFMPHFGNWDIAGAAAVAHGIPLTVVADDWGSPGVNSEIFNSRRSLGMTVVPMGPGAGQAVLSALRKNQVVGLMADLAQEGRAVEVKVMGQVASMPAGPALLSLRTGAPILPTTCRRISGRQFRLEIQPPVSFTPSGDFRADTRELTQAVVRRLEPALEASLEQWYLFSPMWLTTASDAGSPTRRPTLAGWETRRLLLFITADRVFGRLPRRAGYWIAGLAAAAWMTLRPQLTDGLRYNLRQVLPDASERSLRRLARRNIIDYAKAWVDFFTVPRMSRESRDALLSITGWENLNAILERGKGCIPVSIHMGAWDAAIAFWGARYPSALIVEELEPPELSRRMQALRGSTGTKLIPLGRTAPREMLKILKKNGLAAGAMDRDVLGSGEPYTFFGRPALIPTGLVRLAQHTGAGIMPVFCNRLPGDRYLLEGFEPVWVGPGEEGVRSATEKLLRVFEERIRQYPEQWHVTAPLWSDRPIAMSPRPARAGSLGGTREERVG